MTSTIITKNSSTASSVPLAADLTQGELAVNVTDKKLYSKDSGGSVVKLVGSLGNQEANAAAITGGTINGTAIGGTTAAAVSATTLTTSSTVTLNGGTANGVTYLNGSKVLTSGSALTFDGTDVGIGGAPVTGLAIRLLRTSGSAEIRYQNTAATWDSGVLAAGDFEIFTAANKSIQFGVNSSEQMRLTSTGLGIGTSSPNTWSTGDSRILALQGTGDTAMNIVSGSGNVGLVVFGSSAVKRSAVLGDNNANLIFYTNTTNSGTSLTAQATLSSAGNLGLGVTPSAWGGVYKAFQVNGSGSIWANTGAFGYGYNGYYNGSNWIYSTTAAASLFQTYGGGHYWYNAPSGTAGNAISFTQAMTLDASGNLGVGTTSPFADSGYTSFTVNGNSTGSQINFQKSGTVYGQIVSNATNGLVLNAAQNTPMLFYTAGSERARIDSSGNLLVGKTTTADTTVGFSVIGSGGTQPGCVTSTLSGSTNTNTTMQVYSTGASAYRFYVGMGGTVYATSIVITAISDQRLKENVRDIDTGLDAIMALKPRRFDWKEGKGQDKKNVAGFIAQEFETVFPECVGTTKAGADGIEYKNINHETLIPTLVKAIQELKAEFDAYKASHP